MIDRKIYFPLYLTY
jgi:hypothetical protein